jgi:hypothetical protein
MERSDFLKQISSMNRDEINELLNSKVKNTKKIWPAVYIDRSKNKHKNDKGRE